MNNDDRLPPLDPADQEASARLDGMASPELPAGTEDAEVEARRQELGAIVALVSEPVVLPSAATIDAQIAAAVAAVVAAVEADPAPDHAAPGVGSVVALAPHRRARMTSRRWLAAAAAVAVIALVGAVIASNRPHSSSFDTVAAPVADNGASSASSSSTPGADQGATADNRAAGVSPAQGELGTNTAVVDLGAVASDASLAAEVRSEETTFQTTPAPSTTTSVLAAAPTVPPSENQSTTTAPSPVNPFSTGPVAAPTCDAPVRASVPGLGLLVFSATAIYQGAPVEVMVYEIGQPGAYQLVAAQSSDCRVLVNQPL